MGWQFRRSMRVLPGIRANVTHKGVSWTIGPRGFSLSFGKRGVFLNQSVPLLGLYRRDKVHPPISLRAGVERLQGPPATVPLPEPRMAARSESTTPQPISQPESWSRPGQMGWPTIAFVLSVFALILIAARISHGSLGPYWPVAALAAVASWGAVYWRSRRVGGRSPK